LTARSAVLSQLAVGTDRKIRFTGRITLHSDITPFLSRVRIGHDTLRIEIYAVVVPAQDLDEIFAKTLSDYDSDDSAEAVSALQKLASREVFDPASAWCSLPDPIKRARGADTTKS
jgi:hypothetical protein